MIIVEGPDGAGKSTLVEKICEDFELEVGQRGTTDRDKLWTVTRQDTWTALGSECMAGAIPPQVWDRLFFSEFVYAPIAQGRAVEFTPSESIAIKRIMNALAVPIICCLPSWETVEENAKQKHQMEGVNDNLRAIYDAYKSGTELFGQQSMVVYYDYTDPDRTDGSYTNKAGIRAEINHYLESRKDRTWQ